MLVNSKDCDRDADEGTVDRCGTPRVFTIHMHYTHRCATGTMIDEVKEECTSRDKLTYKAMHHERTICDL